MQPAQLRAAERRLARFLGALTPLLGRAERQTHASEYIRGLLLDGERKSIASQHIRTISVSYYLTGP